MITAVPFTFTMPAGWVGENGGITLTKHVGEPDEVGLNVFSLGHIFADACTGSEEDRQEVGETAGDLVRGLMEQRNGAAITESTDITIDGHPATRLHLTVPAELDLATCRPPGPIGIQLWQDIGGKYFVLLADGVTSLYLADIGGERLVLTAQYSSTSSAADIAEVEAIIESIRIELP